MSTHQNGHSYRARHNRHEPGMNHEKEKVGGGQLWESKKKEINNVVLSDFFFLSFVYWNFRQTMRIQKKEEILDLFANENILYFCDGSGRIHQLRSTRENCQTLLRGVQHSLDIRDDPCDVGGDERFLKKKCIGTHIRKESTSGVH